MGWTPLRIGGALSIDGFFSDYAPALDSDTITVSPFAGNTTICPLDKDEYLHEYEQQDESDAIFGIKIPLGRPGKRLFKSKRRFSGFVRPPAILLARAGCHSVNKSGII